MTITRTAVPYIGQRARYAADYLNAEYPNCDPIVPDGEGFWSTTPVATGWDVAMGGRQKLRWDDSTLIAVASSTYGAEAFETWADAQRRKSIA